MNEPNDLSLLQAALKTSLNEEVESSTTLAAHASNRRMYRLKTQSKTVIGILNADHNENDTFIKFTEHFKSFGLPVPEIYLYQRQNGLYLEEDLGNTTLLQHLLAVNSPADPFPAKVEELYRSVLEYLARFQIEAGQKFNPDWCFKERAFNAESILNDTADFESEFLARTTAQFSSPALREECKAIANYLEKAPADFFLYRDFQARNIMLTAKGPFFIDYQGGRLGALQYDVISLLYQASAPIPEEARERLLTHYLTSAAKLTSINKQEFLGFYRGFIVARMLQVLARYGSKGLGQGDKYFLGNISQALATLENVLQNTAFPIPLPELKKVTTSLRKIL